MPKMPHQTLLNMPWKYYPVGFVDFCYVIIMYIISALVLSALINGIILPPYNEEETLKASTWYLVVYLSVIFALQGFLSVVMCAFLELIPSPINGLFGYSTSSPIGVIVRNPAIVTIILFGLSTTLNGIIKIICDRFQVIITENQKRKDGLLKNGLMNQPPQDQKQQDPQQQQQNQQNH